MQSKIGRFIPHFRGPPLQVRRQLHFLMVDYISRRAGVTNEPRLNPKALGIFKL